MTDPTLDTDRNRASVIVTVTANGLTPLLLLVSLYLTFRGHNAPGGGFAGGLVMASAAVVRYLADGSQALARFRPDPVSLVGLGMLIALVVAVVPLFLGGELLESAIWKLDLPAIGRIKVVSSTGFDIGVHVLVVGTVLSIMTALIRGDESGLRSDDPPSTPTTSAGNDQAELGS